MLEVKQEPLFRLTGYQGLNGTVNKGSFMYIAGAFAAAHIPAGTPGNASVGDLRMLPATETINSGAGVFPVHKQILANEGANVDLDTIASGKSLVYYIGGEFETDQYSIHVSGVGTGIGDKLWINDNGVLDTQAGTTVDWLHPIGEIVNVSDFPATANWYNGGTVGAQKKTVWFRLYESASAPQYAGTNTPLIA